MWFSASGTWLVLGGVGLFLAGALMMAAAYLVFRVAVSAAAQEVADRQEAQAAAAARAAQLEAITPQLMRVNGQLHTKAHWGAVEVSEQLTGILVEAVRDGEVLRARIENALLRAEWVRNGGNPEANWKDIVDWKNKQGETK